MGENNRVKDSEIYISIMVAVYNMKDTLDRCIQSLINQTLDHIEIIIVDDGSNDGSGEFVTVCLKDRRIKLIHQNQGLSATREACLKNASGQYIQFC